MKKLINGIIILTCFILVGCQPEPETLGIKKVDQITAELEEVINPALKLQIAYDGNNEFIILHTAGEVSTTITGDDRTAFINFEIEKQLDNEINQYVYILTLEPEQDTIDVSINGQQTHFGSSISF